MFNAILRMARTLLAHIARLDAGVEAARASQLGIGKEGVRMNRLISTCLAVSAIALIAPRSAAAANLVIGDATLNSTITVTASQFDVTAFTFGGTVVNGTTTFSEGTTAPITYA